ncbi:MAG: Pyridoxamine 5-phosphate oxidase [Acidimicrobiales bacterium]|nr:Pyridoxamine 5-phosphate oxidase [Acidimicrobiales bacterium]
MTPDERRQFVRDHRTAIFGYGRQAHGPAMSIVYYSMEPDDTVVVSTMADRAKARAIGRSGKVSLCVLDEQWPPTYLQVYCDAEVEATVESDADRVTDVMVRIAEVMAGNPLDASIRPLVAEGAQREDRVVLRLRPYATFETPPRHVEQESDITGLTHWTSSSQPW